MAPSGDSGEPGTGPVDGHDQKMVVGVSGRRLSVGNLDKVRYPATETTKGEVLHYYATVAPVLLAHLARRPVTRVRWPHGVEGASFFEKNLPAGAPSWLPRVTLSSHGRAPEQAPLRDTVTYPLITDLAALTYLVNLASLELHVPQWQVDDAGAPRNPDRLVIDLDPGPGAGLPECSRVALAVRDRLAVFGLTSVPVTSGSKGMQVYAPVPGEQSSDDLRTIAAHLAGELTAVMPDLVVRTMTKSLRAGKVFLDWSQNTAAKTTISPYSLRGRPAPTAAAPRTWAEVERGVDQPEALRQLEFTEVLDRLDRFGDLAADLLA